jgi:hypothetical protein
MHLECFRIGDLLEKFVEDALFKGSEYACFQNQ